MKYDIVLVGAGLTNATIAALNKDKKILVLEKKDIGGLCRTENMGGIDVHKYGPHIFHTNNRRLWKFINEQADMRPYTHFAKSCIEDQIVDFPINLNTYQHYYHIDQPSHAAELIDESCSDNFQDYLIERIGPDLYDKFYKGYAEKFWNIPAHHLPAFLAKRIPVRTSYTNRYYLDRYEGIPVHGYTDMITQMFEHCDIQNVDFLSDKEYYESLAPIVIYTGSVDEYFDYELGELPYRSMEYFLSIEPVSDYQGVAQMNFPDSDVPYTRIIEHKHFNPIDTATTITSTEYPRQWKRDKGLDRMYPIPFQENEDLYDAYLDMEHKAIFAGRLGSYKYMDMDKCVLQAMEVSENINSRL